MTIILILFVAGLTTTVLVTNPIYRTLANLLRSKETQAKQHSQAIDLILHQDAATRKAQHKVLPLGAFSMSEVIKQLQTKPRVENTSQLHRPTEGVKTHPFVANGVHMNIIDAGTQRGERRKWIPHFQNVDVVLYVVDLACYDLDVSSGTALDAQLAYFDNVLHSRWFRTSMFILFFSNVSCFREKIVKKPLRVYCPDCEVGGEVEYLRGMFRGVNREDKRLYVYFVDPYEPRNIGLVAAAISDSMGLGSVEKGT